MLRGITGTLVDVQDDALTMTLNGSDALTVPITEGEDGSKQLTLSLIHIS